VPARLEEDVRPIFWAHRENSYVSRTERWEDFPSGRFGTRSSTYGEFWVPAYQAPSSAVKESWVFNDMRELRSVFAAYHTGTGKVQRLPWTQEARDDCSVLRKQLDRLCADGLLPINAQPRVNGALSTDPVFGWGGEGGYVYQRAYVEFFCSPKDVETLVTTLEARKGSNLTYMAVNAAGQVHASCAPGTVIGLTWGVFPNAEVKQPCVADFESFLAWKDEAFALWDEWAAIFEGSEGNAQRTLIQEIQSVWFLVAVLDNDFVGGDLFSKLTRIF